MAMAMVCVSPGMLPPTISTTPNSPSVWAKVSTMAETTPGQASGNSMRRSMRRGDMPQHSAASRTSGAIASKARCIGWMAKGRLKTTEATSRPWKEKVSWRPNNDSYH